jgi:hypothetical protein
MSSWQSHPRHAVAMAYVRRAIASQVVGGPPRAPCVPLEAVATPASAPAAALAAAAIAEWAEWDDASSSEAKGVEERASANDALRERHPVSTAVRKALAQALGSYHGRIMRLCLLKGRPQSALAYIAALPADLRLHSRLAVEAEKHGSLHDVREALRLRGALGIPLDRCATSRSAPPLRQSRLVVNESPWYRPASPWQHPSRGAVACAH